jgi:hypothetical protein
MEYFLSQSKYQHAGWNIYLMIIAKPEYQVVPKRINNKIILIKQSQNIYQVFGQKKKDQYLGLKAKLIYLQQDCRILRK